MSKNREDTVEYMEYTFDGDVRDFCDAIQEYLSDPVVYSVEVLKRRSGGRRVVRVWLGNPVS